MIVPSFGQIENSLGLTVQTDKTHYDLGDSVHITGSVSLYPEFAGVEVLLEIWKDGKIIDFNQISPDPDGNFSYSLDTRGDVWTYSTYVVRASYGERTISEATFSLGKFEKNESSLDNGEFHETRIFLNLRENEFYIDSLQQILVASVEIENHTPSNGQYFMKITHLPTNIILKELEIHPLNSGNDLWTAQISYPIYESNFNLDHEKLLGEFEILIGAEYASQTAEEKFFIFESGEPLESLHTNLPLISELKRVSDGIQISWIQDEPIATSFDIVIDGHDTGGYYRTSSTEQVVDSGQCFSVQARYPENDFFLMSEQVCLEPEPILDLTLINNPIITELKRVSDGIQISWIQDEPIATSFDIVIDGVDTGGKHRTSSTTQVVDSGQCFSVQARYPQNHVLLNSLEVCLESSPLIEGFDRFGISHLYPTAGRVFESHWDQGGPRILHGQERGWVDPELKVTGRNPEVVIDGKGTATMQGEDRNKIANPRMFVYDETREKTWKNTEFTVYMMRISENEFYSYAGLNLNSRSEHQDASEDPHKGQGYAGRFTYDGRTMFVKEIIDGELYENADARTYPWNTSNGHMPFNQWIGAKLITYSLPNENVKLELYMDLTDGKNGGDWVKVNEFIDNGTWNSEIFSNPATSVWIKNDGLGVAKYKNFSVREIIPPS